MRCLKKINRIKEESNLPCLSCFSVHNFIKCPDHYIRIDVPCISMNTTPFLIQCGHVSIRKLDNHRFDKIAHVFPKLFWENQESAYIFWNQIPIRWHYTFEFFANFDDVLAVCRMLQQNESGATKATIQTDYFLFDWIFHWSGEDLQMNASFLARKKSYQRYADALNHVGEIQMTKTAFLNEWTILLQQLLKCFVSAGVIINDGTERRKYELLIELVNQLKNYGQLYTKYA